jgi:hypothetical protein
MVGSSSKMMARGFLTVGPSEEEWHVIVAVKDQGASVYQSWFKL